MADSHLNEDQRKLLAVLHFSVQKGSRVKSATSQRRGGKARPVRHQLHRTPSPSQQARSAVHESGTVPAGHRQETGHVAGGHPKIRHSRQFPHQETQHQGAGQGRSPGRHRLTMVTFSLFKSDDGIAGQQQIHTRTLPLRSDPKDCLASVRRLLSLFEPPSRAAFGRVLFVLLILDIRTAIVKGILSTYSWRPSHALDSFVTLPSAKRFPAKS